LNTSFPLSYSFSYVCSLIPTLESSPLIIISSKTSPLPLILITFSLIEMRTTPFIKMRSLTLIGMRTLTLIGMRTLTLIGMRSLTLIGMRTLTTSASLAFRFDYKCDFDFDEFSRLLYLLGINVKTLQYNGLTYSKETFRDNGFISWIESNRAEFTISLRFCFSINYDLLSHVLLLSKG
jgi:hypothetical protein